MRTRKKIGHIRRKLKLRSRVKAIHHSFSKELGVQIAVRTKHKVAERPGAMMPREPDGGILTLPGYFNYGNIVQRFALPRFLENHGYHFVSYVREMPIKSADDRYRFKYTYDFIERSIPRKTYHWSDTPFKAYIVGSDQIWRNWDYDDEKDSLGFFFLDFTEGLDVKRIAYAASIGQSTLREAKVTKRFIESIAPIIKKFNAISVRENTGVQELESAWGLSAAKVVDPTMLLTSRDYSELIDNAPYPLGSVDGAFTYFIRSNSKKRGAANQITQKLNMTNQTVDLEDPLAQLKPVEYWLKGIRDAKLLITDSFHGVVFAILFNTPFILMESGTGGSDRTTTLLKDLGLTDRYIESSAIKDIPSKDFVRIIKWRRVNRKVSRMRRRSAAWLLRALID